MRVGAVADTVLRRTMQVAVRYLPPRRQGLSVVTAVDRHFPPDGTLRRTRLRNGASIAVDLRDAVQASIFYRGMHEPAVTAILTRELRPGDVFCDFGANVGYFTMLASSLVGPTGRVHAFEPSAALVNRLRADLQRNRRRLPDNVSVHPVAVADSTRSAFLARPPGHAPDGAQYVVPSAPVGVDVTETAVVAVDDYLSAVRFDVAKLDVEGCELRALHGMERALDQSPARLLLVERLEEQLERWGDTVEALEEFLGARGYVPEPLTGTLEAPMVAYWRRAER